MILIVDDDDDVREVLRGCLEVLSYEVVEAADGVAALAAMATQPVELVILDFAMPGMNGAEVARAIRQSERRVPIIFASGFADFPALREAAGDDVAILNKPFNIGQLADLIANELKKAGSGLARG